MEIHISIAAERLAQLGPLALTNSMLTMFIVMALLLLVFGSIARNAKDVPGRGQAMFEMIAEFLLNLVEGTGGKTLGRRVFPLVGALFIFIAFSNYTGVLPGIGTIYITESGEAETGGTEVDLEPVGGETPGEDADNPPSAEGEQSSLAAPREVASLAPVGAARSALAQTEGEGAEGGGAADDEAGQEEAAEALEAEHIPLFRPPNADLNMTLAMAVLTFSVVQFAGVRAHGVGGRLKHMADPVFLFPIELISEFSRIISLSARLFGNVFAGEVLLGVIYAMVNAIKIAVVPLAFPIVFIGLELLFGTIQALVFALLTLIYITLASAGHGDHEAGHEAAHDTVTHTEGAHGLGNVPAGAAD